MVILDHVAGFPQPADRAVGPDHAVFLIMVFAGFQATQFAGPDPQPVVRMHAGAEQGVRGRHFADLEAEHAENRIRPIQPVGVDIPVPGADAGKVLAAFEALCVTILVDVPAFGQAVDDRAILRQSLLQRAPAPDQRDDQAERR
ncbi:hypothetical protein D3C78_558840 [compost metagenome]